MILKSTEPNVSFNYLSHDRERYKLIPRYISDMDEPKKEDPFEAKRIMFHMKRRLANNSKDLDETQKINGVLPSQYDAALFALFKWSDNQDKVTNNTKIVADYFDFGCILSEILSVNEELREAY